MKRIFCLLVTVIIVCSSLSCHALELSASSAVLIEAEHDTVLYEKDASSKRTMASTTKIMTAICALEEGDLTQKVKIAPEAVGVEGSSIYLRNGEELTLKELVYGLMLNSGNDAAVAIAYAVSGSVEEFAKLMNKKAKEIGADNSQFKNPNGLDEEGHYTTAYDLAQIAAYAMKNEEFKEIVSTYQTTIPGSEEETKRYLTNHNKLLKRMDGCIGVKTGFTKKSGRCLVSAAERNGVTLVAVTLNAPDDWNDHINMMEFGFERVKRKSLISKDDILQDINVDNGNRKKTRVVCGKDFSVPAVDGKCYVTRYKAKKSIIAPVKKGDEIGKVEFYLDNMLIGEVSAVAEETVDVDQTRKFGKSIRKILWGFVG